MNEPANQPWAVLIVTLIVSVGAWLTVLSGALEATSAPQNFILALSKIGTVVGTFGLLFLVTSRFWSRKP
jgi:uncharacterized membrane protein YozB (DUF420 family)